MFFVQFNKLLIFFDEFYCLENVFAALRRAFASEVSLSLTTDDSRLLKNFKGISLTCLLFMTLMFVLLSPLSFMLVFVKHKNLKGNPSEPLIFMFACSERLEIYN